MQLVCPVVPTSTPRGLHLALGVPEGSKAGSSNMALAQF